MDHCNFIAIKCPKCGGVSSRQCPVYSLDAGIMSESRVCTDCVPGAVPEPPPEPPKPPEEPTRYMIPENSSERVVE